MTVFAVEIIILLLSLFTIFFILPVKIDITLKKIKDEEDFYIMLLLLPGIWSLQLEIKLIKFNLNGLIPYISLYSETENTAGRPINKGVFNINSPWSNWQHLLQATPLNRTRMLFKFIKEVLIVNNLFFKKVTCQRLCWKTYLGGGDPALTAVSTGCIWAIKNILFFNLRNNVKLGFEKPVFEVYPDFNHKVFNIDFNCIFTFRIGHIITAGYNIFTLLVKVFLVQKRG
jgi:hypothetical protein